MTQAASSFEALYTALPEARATARLGVDSPVLRALLPVVQRTRKNSDMGAALSQPMELQALLTEENPPKSFALGTTIYVKRPTDTDPMKLKIVARTETAGVLTLTLGGANE